MKKLIRFAIILASGLFIQPPASHADFPDGSRNLLNHPEDIVYDLLRKCCYITNYQGNNILKRDSLGNLEMILDSINSPMGIALINDTLIISSNSPSRVTVLNIVNYEKIWETDVQEALHLAQIDIDPRDNLVYIMEQQGMVIRFNYRLGIYNLFVPAGSGLAYGSQSVEVDTTHNRLLVFKWPAGYIRAVDLSDSTSITNAAPQGTSQVTASFSGPDNEIYVSCWLCGCIYRYNADLSSSPVEVATNQCDPVGLTFDGTTNTLYICNYTCNTIEVVHLVPTGHIDTDEKAFNSCVSPNPATKNSSIQFTLDKPLVVTLVITNMQGRELKKSSHSLQAGDHSIKLPVENLSTGNYFITLKNKSNIICSEKLVKL